MQIKHVSIKNFRGIKSLDWHVEGRVVCMVGPGDTTKTTILDAIDYALSPRWNIPFSDADFYNAEINEDIVIDVTFSEFPQEFLDDSKYGTYSRGFNNERGIKDDPDDDCIIVLTIRLQVGNDLEPQWHIIKENNPDLKLISWRDRDKLGLARLGDDASHHFTWGRGSVLTKYTDKETSIGSTLAVANRAASKAIADAPLDDLASTAKAVQGAITAIGVKTSLLKPLLDTKQFSFGNSTISLHDENIPLRACGMGTRRLAALAVQQMCIGPEAVILVDEIEHGLEPHRIRKLIKKLGEGRQSDRKTKNGNEQGQVIITTHSPTPIMALPVTCLRFVSSKNGITTVRKVDDSNIQSLQSIARSMGHAFLAKKIIVCEGKTEEAILRVFDNIWTKTYDDESFAYHGVVAVSPTFAL